MAIKKFVVGCFDDEKVLFPAVKKIRQTGYKIHDVYTPYPVHGLDEAMGLRATSLHTMGFIYGLLGLCVGLGGISWILTIDWPLNYGGKPSFSLPSWVPIIFECTVLFSAVGMTMTFCFLNKIAPFVKKHRFHLRATDDLFVMVIETTAKTNIEDLQELLKSIGSIETNVQVAESEWWLGLYSKPDPIFKMSLIGLCMLTALSSCDRGPKRVQNRVYMPDMAYSRALETYDDHTNLNKEGIFYNAKPVSGTIARGSDLPFLIPKDTAGSTVNYEKSKLVKNPLSNLSADDMNESERLYLIYCAICHGAALNGNGPLYKDGTGPFPAKPHDFIADPNKFPIGQMFYSVTYGKNLMGSYASQLTTRQRWMILTYITSKIQPAQAIKATPLTASASTAASLPSNNSLKK